MKKKSLFLLYLLIGCGVFVWLIKVPLLSYYVAKEMRIPISMEWVSVWPHESTIRDLKVLNPHPFANKTALSVEKITCNYQISSLFSVPTKIEKIALNKAVLNLIINSNNSQNNWTIISDAMPRIKHPHPFVIQEFIIDDLTVNIEGFNIPTATTHFSHLAFQDLNDEHGFPTGQIVHAIFSSADIDHFIKDAFNPFVGIEELF